MNWTGGWRANGRGSCEEFCRKPRSDGKGTNLSSKYRMLQRSTLKPCYIIRYADDFKIFCSNYEDARKIFFATKDFLKRD